MSSSAGGGVAPRQNNRIRNQREQGGNEKKKGRRYKKQTENDKKRKGRGKQRAARGKRRNEEKKGRGKRQVWPRGSFFCCLIFTFQLLDKLWSKVWSFRSPGTCLQFLSRIGLSIATARWFSSITLSRFLGVNWCSTRKRPYEFIRVCIRVDSNSHNWPIIHGRYEDSLLHHRGDITILPANYMTTDIMLHISYEVS